MVSFQTHRKGGRSTVDGNVGESRPSGLSHCHPPLPRHATSSPSLTSPPPPLSTSPVRSAHVATIADGANASNSRNHRHPPHTTTSRPSMVPSYPHPPPPPPPPCATRRLYPPPHGDEREMGRNPHAPPSRPSSPNSRSRSDPLLPSPQSPSSAAPPSPTSHSPSPSRRHRPSLPSHLPPTPSLVEPHHPRGVQGGRGREVASTLLSPSSGSPSGSPLGVLTPSGRGGRGGGRRRGGARATLPAPLPLPTRPLPSPFFGLAPLPSVSSRSASDASALSASLGVSPPLPMPMENGGEEKTSWQPTSRFTPQSSSSSSTSLIPTPILSGCRPSPLGRPPLEGPSTLPHPTGSPSSLYGSLPSASFVPLQGHSSGGVEGMMNGTRGGGGGGTLSFSFSSSSPSPPSLPSPSSSHRMPRFGRHGETQEKEREADRTSSPWRSESSVCSGSTAPSLTHPPPSSPLDRHRPTEAVPPSSSSSSSLLSASRASPPLREMERRRQVTCAPPTPQEDHLIQNDIDKTEEEKEEEIIEVKEEEVQRPQRGEGSDPVMSSLVSQLYQRVATGKLGEPLQFILEQLRQHELQTSSSSPPPPLSSPRPPLLPLPLLSASSLSAILPLPSPSSSPVVTTNTASLSRVPSPAPPAVLEEDCLSVSRSCSSHVVDTHRSSTAPSVDISSTASTCGPPMAHGSTVDTPKKWGSGSGASPDLLLAAVPRPPSGESRTHTSLKEGVAPLPLSHPVLHATILQHANPLPSSSSSSVVVSAEGKVGEGTTQARNGTRDTTGKRQETVVDVTPPPPPPLSSAKGEGVATAPPSTTSTPEAKRRHPSCVPLTSDEKKEGSRSRTATLSPPSPLPATTMERRKAGHPTAPPMSLPPPAPSSDTPKAGESKGVLHGEEGGGGGPGLRRRPPRENAMESSALSSSSGLIPTAPSPPPLPPPISVTSPIPPPRGTSAILRTSSFHSSRSFAVFDGAGSHTMSGSYSSGNGALKPHGSGAGGGGMMALDGLRSSSSELSFVSCSSVDVHELLTDFRLAEVECRRGSTPGHHRHPWLPPSSVFPVPFDKEEEKHSHESSGKPFGSASMEMKGVGRTSSCHLSLPHATTLHRYPPADETTVPTSSGGGGLASPLLASFATTPVMAAAIPAAAAIGAASSVAVGGEGVEEAREAAAVHDCSLINLEDLSAILDRVSVPLPDVFLLADLFDELRLPRKAQPMLFEWIPHASKPTTTITSTSVGCTAAASTSSSSSSTPHSLPSAPDEQDDDHDDDGHTRGIAVAVPIAATAVETGTAAAATTLCSAGGRRNGEKKKKEERMEHAGATAAPLPSRPTGEGSTATASPFLLEGKKEMREIGHECPSSGNGSDGKAERPKPRRVPQKKSVHEGGGGRGSASIHEAMGMVSMVSGEKKKKSASSPCSQEYSSTTTSESMKDGDGASTFSSSTSLSISSLSVQIALPPGLKDGEEGNGSTSTSTTTAEPWAPISCRKHRHGHHPFHPPSAPLSLKERKESGVQEGSHRWSGASSATVTFATSRSFFDDDGTRSVSRVGVEGREGKKKHARHKPYERECGEECSKAEGGHPPSTVLDAEEEEDWIEFDTFLARMAFMVQGSYPHGVIRSAFFAMVEAIDQGGCGVCVWRKSASSSASPPALHRVSSTSNAGKHRKSSGGLCVGHHHSNAADLSLHGGSATSPSLPTTHYLTPTMAHPIPWQECMLAVLPVWYGGRLPSSAAALLQPSYPAGAASGAAVGTMPNAGFPHPNATPVPATASRGSEGPSMGGCSESDGKGRALACGLGSSAHATTSSRHSSGTGVARHSRPPSPQYTGGTLPTEKDASPPSLSSAPALGMPPLGATAFSSPLASSTDGGGDGASVSLASTSSSVPPPPSSSPTLITPPRLSAPSPDHAMSPHQSPEHASDLSSAATVPSTTATNACFLPSSSSLFTPVEAPDTDFVHIARTVPLYICVMDGIFRRLGLRKMTGAHVQQALRLAHLPDDDPFWECHVNDFAILVQALVHVVQQMPLTSPHLSSALMSGSIPMWGGPSSWRLGSTTSSTIAGVTGGGGVHITSRESSVIMHGGKRVSGTGLTSPFIGVS